MVCLPAVTSIVGSSSSLRESGRQLFSAPLASPSMVQDSARVHLQHARGCAELASAWRGGDCLSWRKGILASTRLSIIILEGKQGSEDHAVQKHPHLKIIGRWTFVQEGRHGANSKGLGQETDTEHSDGHPFWERLRWDAQARRAYLAS